MLREIDAGCDVVIASRYRPGAQINGVPAHRNGLSLGARYLFQIVFPTPGVRDYTCGYRVYRADVLQRAADAYGDDLITETGFSCMADLLLKLRHLGVSMGEVPLELHYDRRGSGSKMRVLRTVGQTLWLIAKCRFRRVPTRQEALSKMTAP
jgi:dolichol-phosphate mannosyltransferase